MFHNIANTSTSTSALTASLPTVEQVKAWSRDDVKTFLQGNRTRLDLEDEDINKIYTQRVKGSTFLDFTAVDFERWGVPGSPAKEIEKLINEIKGGKRTSFSCPHRVIFANNTEYSLVLFFPASYRQTRPKNTFKLS